MSSPETFTPLADVLERSVRWVLAITGVPIFVPAFALLLLQRSTATFVDWTAFVIPLLLWCAAFAPSLRFAQRFVQPAAGVLILISTLVIGPWSGAQWVSSTIVCLGVVVAIVFSASPWPAALWVGLMAVLDLGLTLSQNSVIVIPGQVGDPSVAFGSLLVLIAGLGLVLARAQWLRLVEDIDAQSLEYREFEESNRREREAQLALAAIERRIHETILNTLAGIAMGVKDDQRELARRACRNDVVLIRQDQDHLPPSTVSDVISAALSIVDTATLDVSIDIDQDPRLSAHSANVLRDAITEALRNVQRHSGSTGVSIEVPSASDVVVKIIDSGTGMSAESQERFGIRNAIRSAVESVGGQATIDSEIDVGTKVTIRIPVSSQRSELPPDPLAVDVLDSSILTRIGLFGTNLFLAIVALPLTVGLGVSWWFTALIIGFVMANALLVVAWKTLARVVIANAGLLIAAISMAILFVDRPGCSQSLSLTWLIAGLSGGGSFLIVLAFRSLGGRLGAAAFMFIVTFAVAIRMPNECSVEPLTITIVCAAYLLSIALGITWIIERMDTRRGQARIVWSQLVDERAQLDRQQIVEQGWRALTPESLLLLQGVADGRYDPVDSAIQTQAATESERIRHQLGLTFTRNAPFDALARHLSRTANSVNAFLDAEQVTDVQRTDALPDRIVDLLADVVKNGTGRRLQLRTFADEDVEEILLLAPAIALHGVEPVDVGDCRVTIDVDDENAQVSVRRPRIPVTEAVPASEPLD